MADLRSADPRWHGCAVRRSARLSRIPAAFGRSARRHRVEVLGISPTLVRALAVHGTSRSGRHDLGSLRIFGSTGEPWNPDPWWWLFEAVGQSADSHHQLFGRNRNLGWHSDGAIRCCRSSRARFRRRVPGIDADVVDRSWTTGTHGSCRRTGDPQALDRHGARFPQRSRALSRDLLVAMARHLGRTATGRSATRTGTGTSSAAATTR